MVQSARKYCVDGLPHDNSIIFQCFIVTNCCRILSIHSIDSLECWQLRHRSVTPSDRCFSLQTTMFPRNPILHPPWFSTLPWWIPCIHCSGGMSTESTGPFYGQESIGCSTFRDVASSPATASSLSLWGKCSGQGTRWTCVPPCIRLVESLYSANVNRWVPRWWKWGKM